MKAKSFIAALAIIASASMLTSCGGSKAADTEQVKSYIMMSSMDEDSAKREIDDYINSIDAGKVKIKKLPDYTEEFFDEEGAPECNPVLEYAKVFLRNNIAGWELDECSRLLSDFEKYPNQSYDVWNFICPWDLNEAKSKLEKVKAGKAMGYVQTYYGMEDEVFQRLLSHGLRPSGEGRYRTYRHSFRPTQDPR